MAISCDMRCSSMVLVVLASFIYFAGRTVSIRKVQTNQLRPVFQVGSVPAPSNAIGIPAQKANTSLEKILGPAVVQTNELRQVFQAGSTPAPSNAIQIPAQKANTSLEKILGPAVVNGMFSSQSLTKWIAQKRSLLKSKGPKKFCAEQRLLIIDDGICAGHHGLGNCLYSIVSVLVASVLSDSFPAFLNRVPSAVLDGLLPDKILIACKVNRRGVKRVRGKKYGAPDLAPTFAFEDVTQDGSIQSGTMFHTYQYIAFWFSLNQKMQSRTCGFYPGMCKGTPEGFGFFHWTFHAFFAIKPDPRVDDVVLSKRWHVEGPLIVIHIRFQELKERSLDCLLHVLQELKLKSGRIYVSGTFPFLPEFFCKSLQVKEGIVAHKAFPVDSFEIRFSSAMHESDQKRGEKELDWKSPTAMTDMVILSKADILIGMGPKSTFFNAAAAIGLPTHLYHLDHLDVNTECSAQLYREACLHSYGKIIQETPFKDILTSASAAVKGYVKFCEQGYT